MSGSVRRLLLCCVGAAALYAPAAFAAQQDDEDDDAPASLATPAPTADNRKLADALGRLARNPRDFAALLDAGQAALEMNDTEAAIGFYQRADAIAPGNARVKAGLGGAYVRKLDPFSAIPLFDEAARAGASDPATLGDRGLAYDLVGDTVSAQRYYHQALGAGANAEVSRRLALSQAIDGDRTGMEATLSPLLQRQDRAAWRTRSFALAVLGKGDEAEAIAKSTMPADLAVAMGAYLRYMPRLTRAQQAAAGDLGYFPRAADIGRDDPRVAQYTRNQPELANANRALTPAGKPLGREAAKPALAAAAPPEVRPTREERPAPPPTVVTVTPTRTTQVAVAAHPPAAKPAIVLPPPRPALTVPGPSFDLAKTTPAPKPTPAPANKPRSLADAFADLAPPSAASAPAAGAVDVRRVAGPVKPAAKPAPTAAEKKAEADKKAAADKKADADKKAAAEKKAEAAKLKGNPARIWVQVATGRDKKALAFDWRKRVKDDAAVFAGKSPFTAAWGQTNRLVTGPFDSDKAANAYVGSSRVDLQACKLEYSIVSPK